MLPLLLSLAQRHKQRKRSCSDVIRTIHGYDAVVIWQGAHAATGLK